MLESVFKSKFVKNVITLMSGTIVAQLVTTVSMFFIARLYDIQEIGFNALYITVIAILSTIAGGRYELAILLPKNEHQSFSVLVVSIWFSTFFSILLLFATLVFNTAITHWFDYPNIQIYIYLLPLLVWITSIYQSFYYWLNRKERFKILSMSKMVQSISISLFSLLAGVLKAGVNGLFWAFVLGNTCSTFLLFRNMYQEGEYKKYVFKYQELKNTVRTYKSFLFFSVPMGFLNAIATNLLIFVLKKIYDTQILGFYSQANKSINYPLAFVTLSFSTVFFQQLVKTTHKKKFYLQSFFINLALASLILVPVLFWGEELFSWVYGKPWAYAGKIAAIISPFAAVSFAARNVSSVYSVTESNKLILAWQVFYLAGSLSLVAYFRNTSLENLLFYLSYFGVFSYLLLFILGYIILKEKSE